jgi:hypothetical protein
MNLVFGEAKILAGDRECRDDIHESAKEDDDVH